MGDMSQGDRETGRLNGVSEQVIGACIEVHRELGPGLLESAYQECLACELDLRGLLFERERSVPVQYKGRTLECGYRLAFVVEGTLIVEIKCVDRVMPIHEAQLLTYLRLKNLWLGLLINFNVPVLKSGIKRIVSG